MANVISQLKNGEINTFSSIKAESADGKKNLFNALENCDKLLNENIGAEIAIKDLYIEKYTKTDKTSGESKTKYRTIIFAEDGTTYVTTSFGIVSVLEKLVDVFGEPTWEEAVKVKVSERPLGNGKNLLTFVLV